jgi:nucleoside 2-deoxyribosyltransferase
MSGHRTCYLAARYDRMEEMRRYAADLRALGHDVRCRWIEGAESKDPAEGAKMDVEDIDECDTLIMFSDPPGTSVKGGGRHWETGFASALGHEIILVGPREIIFHHRPDIQQFDTWNLFLEWIGHA